jgi:hypothetical protein
MAEFRAMKGLITEGKPSDALAAAIFAELCSYRLETRMSNAMFRTKLAANADPKAIASFIDAFDATIKVEGGEINCRDIHWLGESLTYGYTYCSLFLDREVSHSCVFNTFSRYVPSLIEVDLDHMLLKFLELTWHVPVEAAQEHASSSAVSSSAAAPDDKRSQQLLRLRSKYPTSKTSPPTRFPSHIF